MIHTVWMVLRGYLKQRRECLLVLVDRRADLLRDLLTKYIQHGQNSTLIDKATRKGTNVLVDEHNGNIRAFSELLECCLDG